jgi:hypothetical protein
MQAGLLALLISVLCAPYAWIFDEAVLLPALLFGVYRAIESKRSLLPIVAICSVGLVEYFRCFSISTHWYTWTTPAWLAWYLYATAAKSPQTKEISRKGDVQLEGLPQNSSFPGL